MSPMSADCALTEPKSRSYQRQLERYKKKMLETLNPEKRADYYILLREEKQLYKRAGIEHLSETMDTPEAKEIRRKRKKFEDMMKSRLYAKGIKPPEIPEMMPSGPHEEPSSSPGPIF